MGVVVTSASRSIHTNGVAEPGTRLGVVEQRRTDVDVAGRVGAGLAEEDLPVAGRRLVGADLGRHHTQVDGHPDGRQGGVEEVRVRVGQDGQSPAPAAQLGQRRAAPRGTTGQRRQ